MGRWLPAFDYPHGEEGWWLPQTSTINWCEEDYYMTKYAAEVVNTLTNLLFIYLGIKGIRNCIKNKHDTVYLIAFLGYLLVGTGSFLFHSTLKYPMQLVDELSMIYTTCLMCYACFSFNTSRRFCQGLAAGLFGLCVFITAYYHYLQDPSFHQNAYALLTAIVVFRSMYVMEVNIRPSLRSRFRTTASKEGDRYLDGEKSLENKLRDEQILRDMWWMIGLGLAIFLGGFGIWTLDNEYCSTLRQWRHAVGLPWGILLEGHGWWHLMTGIGAYLCLVWGIWLRHCLNERQDDYELRWPSIFTSLPEIVLSDHNQHPGSNGNGKGNRCAKKVV